MEKKLSDYIQYYIGCRCLNTWFTPDHKEYDREWELEGYFSTHTKPYIIGNEVDETWTDSIKPILRRLEDMNQDEAVQLAGLIIHKDEFTDSYAYKNSDGDLIVCWGEPDPLGCDDIYNATSERCWSADQFHYLLKQGFDLFGLLDAGLAVDEKELPHVNKNSSE